MWSQLYIRIVQKNGHNVSVAPVSVTKPVPTHTNSVKMSLHLTCTLKAHFYWLQGERNILYYRTTHRGLTPNWARPIVHTTESSKVHRWNINQWSFFIQNSSSLVGRILWYDQVLLAVLSILYYIWI